MNSLEAFFQSWCDKNGKVPVFDVSLAGSKQNQWFLCKLSVEGFPYISRGNSTRKKIAEFVATRDYIQYLIREKVINASDVPSSTPSKGDLNKESDQNCSQSNSVLQPGMQSNFMGEPYRPYNQGQDNSTYPSIDLAAEEENETNGEDSDWNDPTHGNWTIEAGKSRLHQFLQKNNIKAEYKYTVVGSDECPSFIAEMSIHVPGINMTLTGRESASNKLSASKSCALSLVQQLYDIGMIEDFSGSLKKNKLVEIKPYSVRISSELEGRIYDLLYSLGIQPAAIPTDNTSEKGVSLLSKTVLNEFTAIQPVPYRVLPWEPPAEDFNTWTGYDTSETNLENISETLLINFKEQIEGNSELQQIIHERQKLPIFAKREEILQTISDNSVTIIRGSPGCGKTTQVCQYILDEFIQCGQGAHCNIIVTQPRRISAMTSSDRVAFERSESLGNSVGYSVRFDSCLPRPYGGILFSTVDVLLKNLEGGFRGVTHVIVDEFQEREVYTDYILIVIRDMIGTYPDLKLIILTTTVNKVLFFHYFDYCSIIEISSPTYPVLEYFLEDCIEMVDFVPSKNSKKRKSKKKSKKEDEYNYIDEEDDIIICNSEDEDDDDDDDECNVVISDSYKPKTKLVMKKMNEKETSFELIEALLRHIRTIGIPGAVLIFLPGWSLISGLMRHLLNLPIFRSSEYVILPLHSKLPKEDQRKVFTVFPENVTKVILATDIAETSITINDVVFVIDSCKLKTKIFKTQKNMTHYTTHWASKTNLEQRKSRAGRIRPGMCFHLCSRVRYNKLDQNITPEILRTPLHELALITKMLCLGPIRQYLNRAVQAPPLISIIKAEILLRELKCLNVKEEITALGIILARLPVEPRLGKMLVLGCIFQCGDALATVAANASAFSEVYFKPFGKTNLTFNEISFSKSRFSDHIAMLNVFKKWEEKKILGPAAEENFCRSKMLSLPMLKLVSEAKSQLIQLLTDVSNFPDETVMPKNFNFRNSNPEIDVVVALICMGLYPNVAYHLFKRKVLIKENKIALINKSSVNCSNLNTKFPFPFFIFGEKIQRHIISCKNMTMVTPIHLLLFGARKVDYVNKVIILDDWLPLDMKPHVASAIVALRPAIESVIVKVARIPPYADQLIEIDQRIIDIIKELCELNAGRYGMEPLKPRNFHIPPQDNSERRIKFYYRRRRHLNIRGHHPFSFRGRSRSEGGEPSNEHDNDRGARGRSRGGFQGHSMRNRGRNPH